MSSVMGPGFKTGGRKNIRFRKRRKIVTRLPSIMDVDERVTVLETPIKSESDKKSYRVIRLENGLTALLISDPTTITPNNERSPSVSTDSEEDESISEGETEETESSEDSGSDSGRCKSSTQFEDKAAACALCVKVGSFSDPPHIQGMAHFVEHMVFMGSKKYPIENAFDSFIRKKGGFDNAQTVCEHTTFYFEVPESHLSEGMDRFAQFFVAPLMKQEAMKREMEAIESEFSLAIPYDINRREQLLCGMFAPGHPLRRFMWGNHKSLTPPVGPSDKDLYKSAHSFRQRYYSAHNMTMAVQARLPLEDLERFAINTFGQIPTNDLKPDDISLYSFSTNIITPLFNSFYYVKPVMQTTTLTLTWCMKSFHKEYKSKPHEYVGFILGHEGTGSLLLYLQRKVWALGISTGISDSLESTSIMSMYEMSVVLTEEGINNKDKVLDAIFGYINMLKKECPNERIYEEVRKIEEINFKFKEEVQASDNVEQLAMSMQHLPPKHYMTGQDLFFKYDPEGIEYVIEHMSPDYVNIMLQSPNYLEPIEYDQVEEWFGTRYKRVPIEPDVKERWKNMIPEKDFHLPEPNPFIPNNFDLIEAPEQILDYKKTKFGYINDLGAELKLELIYPSLIKKTDTMQVWHKPDYRFDLPYSSVGILFISPLTFHSTKNTCLLELWCSAMTQILNEKLYAADMTGLTRSLFVHNVSLTMKLYGFSETLLVVIDEITRMFKNYNSKLTKELFVALKEGQIRCYTNTIMKPSKLAKEMRLSILATTYWTTLEKLKAIQDVSFNDLQEFGEQFTKKLYVKMLMQGNLLKTDALQISDTIMNNLKWKPIPVKERGKLIVRQIPLGEKHCRLSSFNIDDETSVISNYYQFGVSDIKSNCILEILMQIMEEPLFDKLRTKEQLGYDVDNTLRYTDGILGFSISVHAQASKYSTSYVDLRIEEFLKNFLKHVKKMSKKSFDKFKIALLKIKNGVDVELKDEVHRHWGEIISSEYQFNRLISEIECVKSLELNEVKYWLDEQLKCGIGCNFRKLSVQIVGHEPKDLLEHVDKKAKLGDQLINTLKERDYSIEYLEDAYEKVEFIRDAKMFAESLSTFQEVKGTLPPQVDT